MRLFLKRIFTERYTARAAFKRGGIYIEARTRFNLERKVLFSINPDTSKFFMLKNLSQESELDFQYAKELAIKKKIKFYECEVEVNHG